MGKMIENKGFCVPWPAALGDNDGTPGGRAKNACIALPIFLMFWDGFLHLKTGFEPQMDADVRGYFGERPRPRVQFDAPPRRTPVSATRASRITREARMLPEPICAA